MLRFFELGRKDHESRDVWDTKDHESWDVWNTRITKDRGSWSSSASSRQACEAQPQTRCSSMARDFGALKVNAQLGRVEFGLDSGKRLFESIHGHPPVLELWP